jgi:putative lipoic acid-binding regulatory protein
VANHDQALQSGHRATASIQCAIAGMSDEENESLFKFPCDFPIKIMGRDQPELHIAVSEIIERHAADTPEQNFNRRLSGKKNYVSITVTIRAQSREQLDRIYQDLTSSPHILYVL